MIVAETIDQVRKSVAQARTEGKSVGFVPTMGALHEGHLSLVRAARSQCDFVVVSIFVNPTQFAPGEDLSSYPRTPQQDLEACRRERVDAVFMPSVEVMYGSGSLTEVHVKKLSQVLCGRHRPGHFDGVCTVVAKLFNIIGPDRAYFGAKDYQQAVIIQRMVTDLNFPIQIVVCPTVREPDGLAMSSRNAYLDDAQRKQATVLYESLKTAERLIHQAHPPARQVAAKIRNKITSQVPDAKIDYVQIVDPISLQDVVSTDQKVLIALAVRIGNARLIDNILVE